MPTQPDNAMTFHTNFISDGPLKAAQNIILDKLEIVPIPNSNQAIGYLTIIDTDSNGKHRGYRHHWGLLKEDARDNDVIDIALFGGKWNTISDDPRWPTIPFETSLIHYFKKP